MILAGNVCRDVDVRYTPKGTAVAEISLAINNSYTDKATGSKKEDVCYVDCTAWGRTAELAGEHLRKGSSVLVDGRLQLDSWEDKGTGTKRTKLKVTIENMQFLGGKPSESKPKDSGSSYAKKESNNFDPDDFPNDDVPF